MSTFSQRADELFPAMTEDRRYLHMHPETGLELPETAAYIMTRLSEMGLKPQMCGGGVTALIEGNGTRTLLLRCDMDALPMPEINDLPFCSKTDKAHTCGHDIHMAMMLGTAKMLLEHKNELKGNIKLMFQPAEEIFKGSKAMIQDGLLENPHVDAAIGMHVMCDAPFGTLELGDGYMSSSCDGFRITVTGRASHGAMPHMGIDPINIGCHIYFALQELIARETPPFDPAILTCGRFESGTVANIISDKAVIEGTLRTYNPALRTHLRSRIQETAQKAAETFGGTAEYEVLSDVPSVKADPEMLKEITSYIGRLDTPFQIITGYRLTPSDDFAFVTEKVPAVFIQISAKTEGNDYAQHNPHVVFNENVMPQGASILAESAVDWLSAHN